jgi:hypothetical protein
VTTFWLALFSMSPGMFRVASIVAGRSLLEKKGERAAFGVLRRPRPARVRFDNSPRVSRRIASPIGPHWGIGIRLDVAATPAQIEPAVASWRVSGAVPLRFPTFVSGCQSSPTEASPRLLV